MLRRALAFAIALASAPAFADEPKTPPPRPSLPAPLSGPIPGAPGYAIDDQTDATYCGGHKLVVRAPKKRPKEVDAELDAYLRLAAPPALSFDAKHKEASTKAFMKWFEGAVAAATKAQARYEKVAADEKADLPARIAAAARIAIIARRFGDLLAYMPIPPDAKSLPDVAAAYCATLAEKAGPLWQKAAEAAAVCAQKADEAKIAPDWWSAICVAPKAAP